MCSVRWFSPENTISHLFPPPPLTETLTLLAFVVDFQQCKPIYVLWLTERSTLQTSSFLRTFVESEVCVCIVWVFFGVASRHHSATFTFGSAGAAISVSSTCTCREQQQQKKNRKEIINIAQTAYMKRHLLKTAAVDCFYYTCLFYISVLAVFYSSSTLLLLTTHCVIVCDVWVCVCPIGSIACNLQHPSSHAYHRNGFIRNNDRRHHKITHSTFRVRKQTEQQPRWKQEKKNIAEKQ